jgi:hypothetical protein
MKGDDRVRFCDQCRKNVTNISSMSREEAETFLEKTNGSECIQLWKRPDGTIVTSDCGRPSPKPPMVAPLGGAPMPPPPPPPKLPR